MSLVRFGPFELNTATGELRKNGLRIRLQEQPFKLLALLVENPGAVVAREELIRSAWPEGTFVEFDHGLNAAITRIRQALNDSAERPRYVETVARKGYRFIAPVEVLQSPLAATLPNPPTDPRRSTFVAVAACLVLIALVVGFGFLRQPQTGHSQTRRDMRLVQLTRDSGLTMDPTVSSDGKLLAYVSDRGSRNLNVWVQQLVPGGSSIQITRDNEDAREPSFSPDGSKIVFRSEKDGGGIYIVPSIGGPVTQIAPKGRSPRFSPDGKWIAYWVGPIMGSVPEGDGTGTIHVTPASGGAAKVIAADIASAIHPIWSPDSKTLLAYCDTHKERRLSFEARDWCLVALDGSASRRTGAFATLRQQGFRVGYEDVPRAFDWTGNTISFSATLEDTTNAWRIEISPDDWRFPKPAERLTAGTTIETAPILANGRTIFGSLNRTEGVWSLSMNPDRPSPGLPTRLTNGGAELTPSVSEDGRFLTYTSRRTGNPDVWIKDLATGLEEPLASTSALEWHPQISRDGSMIAFTTLGKSGGEVFTIPRSGGKPARNATSGGFVWSISDRLLLFKKLANRAEIQSLDLKTQKETVFLSRPGYGLHQSKLSPDQKWIVLEAADGSGSSLIFVVPAHGGVPAPPEKWIRVSDKDGWNDKPRWSPDGSLIYFISHRDGFRCLWAQRLDPSTKRPIGEPAGINHFHETRLSMMNVGLGGLEIDVAKDKVIFVMGELTGNIWSMEPTS